MVALPPKDNGVGAETRILLAECGGPVLKSYTLAKAKESMQLMDRVIWNRMANPAPYLARGAKTVADIIKAPGQFAGFGSYPDYDGKIVNRIQSMINIANSTRDKRNSTYADFITTAIEVAKAQPVIDPSPGKLTFWRTAGSGGPGGNATHFKTVLGVDFYYEP